MRDHNGRFISVGDSVNVKGDDGKDRRGTVTQLTKMGPQVTYDDGKPNPVEIVPSADSGRITVAPKAAAKIAPAKPRRTPKVTDVSVGDNPTPTENTPAVIQTQITDGDADPGTPVQVKGVPNMSYTITSYNAKTGDYTVKTGGGTVQVFHKSKLVPGGTATTGPSKFGSTR